MSRWTRAAMAVVWLFLAVPAGAQQYIRITVGLAGAQPDGANGTGLISANGQFVAFVRTRRTWWPATPTRRPTCFVRDLADATTTRVSLATDGLERSGAETARCRSPLAAPANSTSATTDAS